MDRFTDNTTPEPDGPGVVWYCPYGADMPESFDHSGLDHSADPNAGFSGGQPGILKGSTSNPGLVPVDAPGQGVFRGSMKPA